MELIKSVNNPLIKRLTKLKEKKYRDQEQLFLIEGEHLVYEANNKSLLEMVITSNETKQIANVRTILVTEEIIKKLSHTKTPQQIIGVVKYLKVVNNTPKKFLILDNIQDPGNLGTLIRSCLAFNIDKIFLSKNTVDIYNDKVLRSTQGAIFNIDIEYVDLIGEIKSLKEKNIPIFGTVVEAGINLEQIEPLEKYALILGNEANGISAEVLELTTKNITIKTNEKLESLNVAIAGSIILYNLNKKS